MPKKRHGQLYTILHEFFALSYPFLYWIYRRTGRGTVIAPGVRVFHPWRLKLGRRVTINSGTRFQIGPGSSVEIGDDCRIESNVVFAVYNGFVKFGNHSGVQTGCILHGRGGLTIGDNVMIAAGCVFVPFSHNYSAVDKPMISQGVTPKGIVLEDDVWLGTGVRVLTGVRIGRGAIVGAGAVVNRDIPPYAVAVGVPARVVRYRYDRRIAAADAEPPMKENPAEADRAALRRHLADILERRDVEEARTLVASFSRLDPGERALIQALLERVETGPVWERDGQPPPS